MNIDYKLLLLLVCSLSFGLYSCSSDNEELIEAPDYDLIIDSEIPMIKVGESSQISITEGNGEYKAFLLNPAIAEINIVENVISIEGKSIGQTDLIITDKNTNVKKIPLSVYEFDKIRTEGDIEELTFDILLGQSSQKEVIIVEGNKLYTVESADPTLVNASIRYDSKVIIQTERGNKGGETTLTITDQCGVKQNILIKVNTSLEAFSEEDKEAIHNEQFTSSLLHLFGKNTDSSYQFTDKTDEGRTQLRAYNPSWSEYYRSEVYITFTGDRSLGKVKDGKIFYYNFPQWDLNESKDELDLMDLEIIQNDESALKLIFSFLDENEVLSPGYMVIVK
ncbi:MAG: hypothetical protein ACRC9P_08955 [Bacteroides sp.]